MHNVCKINRASLYFCEEDGVNDVTQAVYTTYCNALGLGPNEKIVQRAVKIHTLNVQRLIFLYKIDYEATGHAYFM